MDRQAFKALLRQQARFTTGMIIHWRGTACKITGRYWRRRMKSIVYDLEEVGREEGSPRIQSGVLEKECKFLTDAQF